MGERFPTEYEELAITRLKEGGFVVRHLGYGPNMTTELFESTSIGDALRFVEGKLVGNPPDQSSAPVQLASFGVNQKSGLNPNRL